jgi:site-specific recombinase XerD
LGQVPRNHHLIRDAFRDWVLSREALLRRPKTIDYYDCTAGGFVKFLIEQGLTLPNEIRSINVRRYITSLANMGLADSSIYGHARGVMAFLRFFYDEDTIRKPRPVQIPRVVEK